MGLTEGVRGIGKPTVAYFCMEYGIDPSLPIYAGGLGILAGDHFKAAAELGLPFYAVGVRWREGYVHQELDENGRQIDVFREWDPPSSLRRTGVQVRVTIEGKPLDLDIWCLERGSAVLLLLDVAEGTRHPLAGLARRLYEGTPALRVAQEMVLGIGGVRALARLGVQPDVYHLNEGHAVFAGIELIRRRMDAGASFLNAWRAVRQQLVFTTHTPVPAGNEEHPHDLLQRLGAYNGLGREEMVAIGGDPFSMTAAALRLCRLANAVSTVHGRTARNMWRHIHDAAPIISITNGVHRQTWQHPAIAAAYAAGERLFPVHQRLKEQLLARVRERCGQSLSPQALLIGSARRATPYKRATLLFRRPDVIGPLLESGRVAVLYAGKAHPKDEGGKELIAQLVQWSRRYPHAVCFLTDYDMELARLLVQGCDVWLNQPVPPLEASGTSGIKAAMNGVLNLSILDGWWAEGCDHGRNGWQFGGGYQGPDQDDRDAADLYRVLQEEVLPAYAEPHGRWESMMRRAVESTIWAFSAQRMVLEYWNLMYGHTP